MRVKKTLEVTSITKKKELVIKSVNFRGSKNEGKVIGVFEKNKGNIQGVKGANMF